MSGAIERFLNWWHRPPAEERILDAMSFTEWRSTRDVIERADFAFVADFYRHIVKLEASRMIESTWATEPKPRRRMYRKLVSGKRRQSPDINVMPVHQYG